MSRIDPASIAVERTGLEGRLLVAVRGGMVTALEINPVLLQGDLRVVGPGILEAYLGALEDFGERALGDGAVPLGAAEQRLLDEVSFFADRMLRDAPPAPVDPDAEGSEVLGDGFVLRYSGGVLVGIDLADSVVHASARDLASALRDALNRHLTHPAALPAWAPPQVATLEELGDLASRIHDLERGIYR